MTREVLSKQSKDEVLEFIRTRLKFDKSIESQLRRVDKKLFATEHRRFDMSGYETETGECTKHNLNIVNEFADLGIYDHTNYLFLDFYKGILTLYMQYWGDPENLEFDLSGIGTSEIIYFIFEKTIFTGEGRRRRI
jgi:hypothetical protein